MRTTRYTVLAGCLLAAIPAVSQAQIQLLATGSIPGDARDKRDLKGLLDGKTPHDRLGGMGSGIAYTGQGNRYALVCDRGPNDGAVPFHCRVQWMDITATSAGVKAVLVETTLLVDSSGEPFVGHQAALGKSKSGVPLRLDPESICFSNRGTLYIADEYGPCIHEFDRKGRRIASIKVPSHFTIARPSGDPKEEEANNKTGRAANRGFEGLTITPDGRFLFAIVQGPLIQDGGREGCNVRLLEITLETGATREFIYPLGQVKNGVSEILAINRHDLLVLERDSRSSEKAPYKKIYKIDVRKADDVSVVASLPHSGMPKGISAVAKTEFLDFFDPRFKIGGKDFPDKMEGMTFGPDLPDGRRLLLTVSDNDFRADVPTRFFAFAIDAKHLPGFERQQIQPQK